MAVAFRGGSNCRMFIESLEGRTLMAADPLHVDGNHLEDAAGNTVRLTGANVVSLDWQSTGDHVLESIAQSMDVWQANMVRLPLNQGYWINNTNNYRNQVAAAVNAVASRDKYVMLDLHGYGQPDANSTVFWQSVASTYANNPSVLFDLFNEPHGISWSTWQSSMQGLLNTVRNTGANNIVVAGGLDWGFDLSGVASGAYALNDPLATDNLMYGSHVYPMKSSNWSWAFGNLAATKPVFVGEFGEDYWDGSQGQLSSPGDTFTTSLLDYLDSRGSGGISWTAWAMYPTTSPNLLQFQPGDTWIWDDWTPSTLGNIVKDRLASYQDPSAPRALWGPTIGTTGSYSTGNTGVYTAGDGANAVFDGSLSTYFDAPSGSWNTAWVGQDLGAPHQITKIAFAPRSGFASRMTGGVFQASNTADFSSGVVTLHTVSSTPSSGWQSVNVSASSAYRYVRYVTPAGGGCNIAQLMFYGKPTATTPVAIAVQDYSFESPVASDGGTATRPASWTSSHSSWIFNPTNNHFAGTSGTNGNLPAPAAGKQMISLDLNGSNLTRTLTYNGTSLGTYEAGATYTLTVAGGQRLDQPAHWQDPDGVWRNHYIRFTVSLLARDNASSPWVVVDTSAEATLTAVGTFADATDIYTATSALAGKQIGIRVTAMGSWTQAQIDNVRLTKSASSAPAPTFTNADVGNPAIAGSATVNGSVYTVKGSGADIWNTSDQFNYHSTSVTGDQTIVARITGLTNTHSAAKAGVMFRNSSASNSAFAMVSIKPNGGIEVLSRGSTGAYVAYRGGATTGITPSTTTPIWVKLVRSGSTFSAYYATGTATPSSWVLIATFDNVTFTNTSYLAGLAVNSHHNGLLATGTFDNVSLT